MVAAFEVVSPGPKARWKDETKNPPLFARQGVDYCVLVYPQEYRKPSDAPLRVFADPTPVGYATEMVPDRRGFFLLRTIGVRIGVEKARDGVESIVLLDARTGQRLQDAQEAIAQAEKEAAERKKEAAARKKEAVARKKEAAARKKAEQEKKQETAARKKAEQEKKQETAARKKAEQLNLEMMVELEQLRARLRERDEGEGSR